MVRLVTLCLLTLPVAARSADRVAEARKTRTADVQAMFEKAGVRYPPDEVYLRAFKQERVLELWAGKKGAALTLVKSYPFCAASGELGPKRMEGDLQVPEGFYDVVEFNPQSNFHLSLKVSYPNASDRVRSDKARPGGLIYLHGNCASIGCIAIEDGPIEEVYLTLKDAKVRRLPFHIFPARLTAEVMSRFEGQPHAAFWKELAPGFAAFEATKRPPRVSVDAKSGAYRATPGR